MHRKLSIPTAFTAVEVAPDRDATETARTMAADGAEPGTLVWAARDDRVDCAVVLAPEAPLRDSLPVSYVLMVGIGDALGAVLPPVIAVTFGWPDRILVNGATAGGIRVSVPDACSDDAVPDWMVAGVTIALKHDRADEGGHQPGCTTLEDEGCGAVGAIALLESFSRHLLYWIDRWLEEGFAPVKTAWLSRAAGYGPNEGMETSGAWSRRTLLRLQNDGSIRYAEGDQESTAPIAQSLQRPTWSL